MDMETRATAMASERALSTWNPLGLARRLAAAFAAFGVFTAVGLFFAIELYAAYSGSAEGRPFRYYLVWTLPTAWSWYCVFPIILWCTRRWPFERDRWRGSLAAHAAVFVGLVIPIQAVIDTSLSLFGYSAFHYADLHVMLGALDHMILSCIAGAPVPFTAIAGLVHGARYYRKYRERELEAARLENALNLARLQCLQSQLNPHFLFNTLNAIGALSRKDPESTNRMVAMLCGLLRRSLDSSDRHLVPLREEIDLARDYLDIERMRFPDRLNVAFDVPSDLLALRVPSLILQPLAENAVQHGIAPRSTPGHVTIRARIADGTLDLVVEDDGAEPTKVFGGGRGHGLRITRERLFVLYENEADLELSRRPEGGTRATIRIPLGRCLAPTDEEAAS